MKTTTALITSLLIIFSSAISSAAEMPVVRMKTTAGEFLIQLDDERAPISVANFLKYVEDGFYEGTLFHRIENGFIIQGGGYDAEYQPRETRPSIPNESGNGLSNLSMTIAMARTNDPHTADSQFYINLADNSSLDPKPTRWGYAVFGSVIEGEEVVNDIGYRATSPQPGLPKTPAVPIIIESVMIVE